MSADEVDLLEDLDDPVHFDCWEEFQKEQEDLAHELETPEEIAEREDEEEQRLDLVLKFQENND